MFTVQGGRLEMTLLTRETMDILKEYPTDLATHRFNIVGGKNIKIDAAEPYILSFILVNAFFISGTYITNNATRLLTSLAGLYLGVLCLVAKVASNS